MDFLNNAWMMISDSKNIRTYHKDSACIFKKNNEEFGTLSNMATGFPLKVNEIKIRTSEALYQACKFPHLPNVQEEIIHERSPMAVKMISRANNKECRKDWDAIKIKIMKWCLSVKLAQNFVSFGSHLCETGLKNIVENSAKDDFWGAIPNKNGSTFKGKNALGRLLMDLRKEFYSQSRYSLLVVRPLEIKDFNIYDEPIKTIDERFNFMEWLKLYWQSNSDSFNTTTSKSIGDNLTANFIQNDIVAKSSLKSSSGKKRRGTLDLFD